MTSILTMKKSLNCSGCNHHARPCNFDTHILLWALTENEKLPVIVKDLIADPDIKVFYSSVSIWEVAIKYMKNPAKISNISPEMLIDFCDNSLFLELPVTEEHVLMLQTLSHPEDAPLHNDPFGRILIAQAKSERMTLLTHDSLLTGCNEPCIIVCA